MSSRVPATRLGRREPAHAFERIVDQLLDVAGRGRVLCADEIEQHEQLKLGVSFPV